MIIQKNIIMIIMVALVVFSHGCVELFDNGTINDSETMNEYNEYLDIYNDDSQKYNDVVDDWIVKKKNYDDLYKGFLPRKPILDSARERLLIAIDNYKNTANSIYTHLEVFEQFIIINEDTLKRNNVSTVQLKGNIQEWKEEIRLNSN